MNDQPIHATTVAIRCDNSGNSEWRGVVLRGSSGIGKSDLALQLIAMGGRLVADDRTLIWASGDGVFARCPSPIRGLIEARSVGIMTLPAMELVRVRLVVDLYDHAPERCPDPQVIQWLGLTVPLISVDARSAGAASLIHRVTEAL